MSQKILLAFCFLLSLANLSCSKENDASVEIFTENQDFPIDVSEPEPEIVTETNLVNVLNYYQFSSRILKLIAEKNSDLPLDFTFHNVTAHKIIYNTTDQNLENTIASGVLLLPDKEGDLPLLSFQHGTLLDPELTPSKSKFGNNELTLAAVLASSGIITVVPDYLGYGNSPLAEHPYEHKTTLANASYDLLKASIHYIKENEIPTNDSLFIAGYSEGGFATIALQQRLEKENEFNLIQSYAGAGAYNKTAFTKMILEAEETQAHMGYYLWVLYTYNSLYEGLQRPWSEYINEPYATELSKIESFKAPIADSLISKNVAELFQPKFISGIINETDTVFLEALEDNNVYDWKPKNPIGLFHSKNDSLVNIINSKTMLQSIENNGGQISLQLINGESHRAAAIPFYLSVLYDIMETHQQK